MYEYIVDLIFPTSSEESLMLSFFSFLIKNQVYPENKLYSTKTKLEIEKLTQTFKKLTPEFKQWFVRFSDNLNSKALVVGGVNLYSSVGYPRFSLIVMKMIQLPPYQYDVIIGLLLSDGWLTFPNTHSKNPRLGFKQSMDHFEYLWCVFTILSHYCSSLPHSTTGVRGNRYYGIQIFTRCLPCFKELHLLFYINGGKVIPQDIYNLLTPVALAHLIMGDGSVRRHGLIICTQSFTIQDTVRLINVLIIRYNLICSIHYHGGKPQIYISQKSMVQLRTIVSPFIIPSMLYKLEGRYK
jgi:LAGLIDADG DNA endonuclease family